MIVIVRRLIWVAINVKVVDLRVFHYAIPNPSNYSFSTRILVLVTRNTRTSPLVSSRLRTGRQTSGWQA